MVRPSVEGSGAPLPTAVRPLRWLLFALLLASALGTLFVMPSLEQAVAAGRLPKFILVLPSAALAAFVAAYAVYRFLLVRAGRYPAGKALVRIGVMVLVVGIVAGASLDRFRAARVTSPVDVAAALASADPQVRALAAEVLRHRGRAEATPHAARLVDLLEDPSPEVRRQAHLALVTIAGEDAGGQGPDAPGRWRTHLRARGDLPR